MTEELITRQVDSNSRTAAFLRYAGLTPSDIPGEGQTVSLAEAEAEARRRGIEVTLPDPLPALTPDQARGFIRPMMKLGAHLIRLWAGTKKPVEVAWQSVAALTEEEAVEWLSSGGNLGINLLRSGENGWVALDAENTPATQLLIAAGFVPTAVTANAQDPTSAKLGGCHVWLALPPGTDPSKLKSRLQIPLEGGGLIDVLDGTRYAIAPGSRLDSAPGFRYGVTPDGAVMDHSQWVYVSEWLMDPAAEAPDVPGIAPLRGVVSPPPPRVRPAPDSNADRITAQIDEIAWEEWLDGDPRVQILGVNGPCGCDWFHWAGASTQRSGILHDGCSYGFGVHIFSGTLEARFGSDHGSRLQFAAFLRGKRDDLGAVAAQMGIAMNRPLRGISLDDIRAAGGSPHAGLRALPGGGEDGGETIAPTALTSVPRIGTLSNNDVASDGAVAQAPEPLQDQPEPEAEENEDDTGLALFERLDEVDATGFWDSLPILRRIRHAALTNGIYQWGLLGATLPRIACNIPPHVRLVGASGKEGGQNSGASLNLNSVLIGAPEAGKSETIKLSQDLVTLPDHTVSATTGTGEGIIKSYGYMRKSTSRDSDDTGAVHPSPTAGDPDPNAPAMPAIGSLGGNRAAANGYEYVHITDTVMVTAGEISGMIAEMSRQGTKMMGVLRSAWVGEQIGVTAGEVERRSNLEPHTYRFGSVLGAQVSLNALGPIFDEGDLGSPQRFGFFPVKTIPAAGEPVRTISLPYIDWYDGQAPAATVAGLVGVPPNPVFIKRPPAAHEEIEAHKEAMRSRAHLPFSVAEVRRRADEEDSLDDIRGHELLHQLKYAAVLAVGDGLKDPTDEYWHAAAVIMEVRDLMQRILIRVLDAHREVADRKRGRAQGRSQAEARRAEQQARQDYETEVARRIVEILTEKGAPSSEAEISRKLGKAQATIATSVIAEMVHGGALTAVSSNNRGKPLYWITR